MSPTSAGSRDGSSSAAPSSIRAVITGTAALNGGDAAILEGELAILQRAFPDVEVAIFDQQAELSGRYYPELGLRPALFWMRDNTSGRLRKVRWGIRMVRLLVAAIACRMRWRSAARVLVPTDDDWRDLMTYAAADVVLTPGGTMLVEQYQFLPRLLDYTAVLMLGRPLVFFTQSLGPFRPGGRRRLLAAVLRRARLVLVRGEESRRHVTSLGVAPERCRVVPDAAFVLRKEGEDAVSELSEAGPLRVALSLREWPFFRSVAPEVGQHRYEDAVAELCTWLVREHGAEIVCVSTCQGTPEYWMDDSLVAERVSRALPADVRARVAIDREFHRPTELRDRLGGFHVTVATRFHAAILSLCAGTPVVAIEYERKATEAFAELGLGDWVMEIEQLDGSALIEVMGRMIDELPAVRDDIARTVADQQRRALAVADDVRAALRL